MRCTEFFAIRKNAGNRDPFIGILNEVSLCGCALDGHEINEIFAGGGGRQCPIDESAAPIVNAGPAQSIAQSAGTVTCMAARTMTSAYRLNPLDAMEQSERAGNVTFAGRVCHFRASSFSVAQRFGSVVLAGCVFDILANFIRVAASRRRTAQERSPKMNSQILEPRTAGSVFAPVCLPQLLRLVM